MQITNKSCNQLQVDDIKQSNSIVRWDSRKQDHQQEK